MTTPEPACGDGEDGVDTEVGRGQGEQRFGRGHLMTLHFLSSGGAHRKVDLRAHEMGAGIRTRIWQLEHQTCPRPQ